MDLQMLSYFGSRERTVSDWDLLFKEADERFELKNAIGLNGPGFILEVWWKAWAKWFDRIKSECEEMPSEITNLPI